MGSRSVSHYTAVGLRDDDRSFLDLAKHRIHWRAVYSNELNEDIPSAIRSRDSSCPLIKMQLFALLCILKFYSEENG
jgi:hypothetical protein